MVLKRWNELPEEFKVEEVKKYYDVLMKKRGSLILKRIFDVVVSMVMLFITSPVFAIVAFLITMDSKGGVFYRQTRITTYGKEFRIHKFRTMVANADKIGTQVTVGNDARITKIGAFLRKYRLDELPQLLDVLNGNMSFVGTRPEVPKYVNQYTNEMKATLLMPAGITSKASILYKEEAELLDSAKDVDAAYVKEILPQKMKYNLQSLETFSFWKDIAIMFQTVFAVFRKD